MKTTKFNPTRWINRLAVLSIILFAINCKEEPVSPTITPMYGLTGKIYDTEGNIISGASIRCLFYLQYIPIDLGDRISSGRIRKQETFIFELFQPFPNPTTGSMYFRFSLPEECDIEISIRPRYTSEVRYRYTERLPYGLYQRYLSNFADSLGLTNGIYTLRLYAAADSGKVFESEKQVLVVGNDNVPNAMSDLDGTYFFNIDDVFIGDSIAVMSGDSFVYFKHLGSTTNLLITKEGYESKIQSVQFLPSVVLSNDIILKKIQ